MERQKYSKTMGTNLGRAASATVWANSLEREFKDSQLAELNVRIVSLRELKSLIGGNANRHVWGFKET